MRTINVNNFPPVYFFNSQIQTCVCHFLRCGFVRVTVYDCENVVMDGIIYTCFFVNEFFTVSSSAQAIEMLFQMQQFLRLQHFEVIILFNKTQFLQIASSKCLFSNETIGRFSIWIQIHQQIHLLCIISIRSVPSVVNERYSWIIISKKEFMNNANLFDNTITTLPDYNAVKRKSKFIDRKWIELTYKICCEHIVNASEMTKFS